MPMPVFCAVVDIRPLDDCSILNPKEIAGAALRCYTLADSESDARARIEAQLLQDRFEVECYEWCVDVDSVEWDNPDSPSEAELIREARTDQGVVYDTFHPWGFDS